MPAGFLLAASQLPPCVSPLQSCVKRALLALLVSSSSLCTPPWPTPVWILSPSAPETFNVKDLSDLCLISPYSGRGPVPFLERSAARGTNDAFFLSSMTLTFLGFLSGMSLSPSFLFCFVFLCLGVLLPFDLFFKPRVFFWLYHRSPSQLGSLFSLCFLFQGDPIYTLGFHFFL